MVQIKLDNINYAKVFFPWEGANRFCRRLKSYFSSGLCLKNKFKPSG